ncbi:hypothetical protein FEI17_05165 [Kosakonia radicincitans]|uniref:Lipoprotein SmpA/OmlA domain-containing protein n=1 Tax=Kosakonia radicincitans TaxID=283686 RepID=A0AAX2EQ57_9ENTR|nr:MULTISPECIES: hypothetical protein [Kosakonia]MDP9565872.1 hypothetical protein [Kosakonia oryzae]MDD7998679.1 hypothetical protein [Kosakonia radicincitans]NCF06079.1 hypothetical protein [Kosakonia sp. MH5]NCF08869.1 hypothetical protein [Kosakonia sp. MH5]PTA89378.1 hypothetical protein CWM66_20040 [Kosakonia sp. H7A]
MNSSLKCLVVVSAILLSACSSMGGGEDKFSASYVQSHIVEGKTTKAQVQQLYGVPDDNEKSSNGTTWVYHKNADYSSVSSLAGYIPGAGAVSSALGMANTASEASSTAGKLSDKRSGNTEIHGNRLYITFNRNDVVDYWSIN